MHSLGLCTVHMNNTDYIVAQCLLIDTSYSKNREHVSSTSKLPLCNRILVCLSSVLNHRSVFSHCRYKVGTLDAFLNHTVCNILSNMASILAIPYGSMFVCMNVRVCLHMHAREHGRVYIHAAIHPCIML